MTSRRARKSARSSRSSKPAAAAPDRRLIAAAVAALVVAIYAFYYLDHLPQAETVRAGEIWRVEPGEQLRLHGMPPGTALYFNLRTPGSAKLSFGPGAVWESASDAGVRRRTDPRGFEFSLFNVPDENLEIGFALSPASPDAQSMFVIELSRPDPRYLELSLRSDAPLTVDFGIVLDPQASAHGRIVAASGGSGEASQLAVHDGRLAIPPGATVRLGMPVAQAESLATAIGDLAGFEIGAADGEDFERRAMACGAERGRVLWQRIVPRVRVEDCRRGRIAAASLRLGQGVEIAATGTGFTVRDGATTHWAGFRDFRQNDVVKLLLGTLLAGLVGWVTLIVRQRYFS